MRRLTDKAIGWIIKHVENKDVKARQASSIYGVSMGRRNIYFVSPILKNFLPSRCPFPDISAMPCYICMRQDEMWVLFL